MTQRLIVQQAGPLMTLQDGGRPGHLGAGLSAGGAMDRLALIDAAALLWPGAPHGFTLPQTIEMAGVGGTFHLAPDAVPVRFALTGAVMPAQIDGAPLVWHASHVLHPGQTLRIGAAQTGTYGYLTPAGGIQGPRWLDSIAAHLGAGIGQPLLTGQTLDLGPDAQPGVPRRRLPAPEGRIGGGGTLRIMPGPQTDMFDAATRDRLSRTRFRRGLRANRTGVPLDHDGAGFVPVQRNPVSDFICPGDVQITGNGTPFVLLAECQTIGGYPRIGTVIAGDLACAAQAQPGSVLQFRWITAAQADDLFESDDAILRRLLPLVTPLRRDPADMTDLLSYQLISGATAGTDGDPAT